MNPHKPYKGLPTATAGVELIRRRPKGFYVKTASLSTKNIDFDSMADAERHARFYQRLVREGLYHPKTQFVVARDDKGNPTVMMFTPKLTHLQGINPNETLTFLGRDKKRLDKALVTIGEERAIEFSTPHNWGQDPADPNYYYTEFYIMPSKHGYKLPKDFKH
ncbi:MAG: hypothetical protein JXB14_06360 [Candidatus Altiarchaeota archaeon]|nr:hypothetical protein [Candidatus Altiarchaeota archaeon]